jgi:hypothetical protein
MPDEPAPPSEWLKAMILIAVVIGVVALAFAFVLTNGFAPCCTQPAPGFTPVP